MSEPFRRKSGAGLFPEGTVQSSGAASQGPSRLAAKCVEARASPDGTGTGAGGGEGCSGVLPFVQSGMRE